MLCRLETIGAVLQAALIEILLFLRPSCAPYQKVLVQTAAYSKWNDLI